MDEWPGTHDLMKAEIGDECESVEITVTEEMVERNAWANDDYNPWYMDDSPFGGRIASPVFLSCFQIQSMYSHYRFPAHGTLNTRQEFEFINPLKIGKRIKMTCRVADQYRKKGRDYIVFECLIVDEDGLEIVRMKRHTVVLTEKKDITGPTDPTAFRPMKVTASRETEVGFELEPITKRVTLDKTRLYQEWPQEKNIHTDYAKAQRLGHRQPIVMANQVAEYIGELLVKFFGQGYLGGNLSLTAIRIIWVGDEITTKGVVREKVAEGDAIRLILDIWCENQHGEKVVVGTASGLVR